MVMWFCREDCIYSCRREVWDVDRCRNMMLKMFTTIDLCEMFDDKDFWASQGCWRFMWEEKIVWERWPALEEMWKIKKKKDVKSKKMLRNEKELICKKEKMSRGRWR